MSRHKQDKAIQRFLSQTNFKPQLQWFLRSLVVITKQNNLADAGFVLPTVTMVSMVVVLLTTAIVFRSFDRSKNATYARVNQAVLNAANPALDRARAKLDALFADPTLPRATPSDLALYTALTNNRYSFGDEERLKLVKDINGVAGIQTSPDVIENDDTLRTAWRFPVDTDNNGKFDSYTLYGIYFRSPTRGSDGKFNRARNPLEARTPPMRGGNIGNQCANAAGTSASLVGDSSWYKSGGKLTKSFFVYTATVPITEPPPDDPDNNKYYEKGKQSFSALEYQQDRSLIPLSNNAAVFQDDLELTPGSAFRMNGRVFTNANLLIGGRNSTVVRLYQVSSKNSCFYEEENSKITVGGNVGTGNVADTSDQNEVTVDLFKGFGNDPGTATINSSNKSTNIEGGAQVAYNDAAYNRRIAVMKRTALSLHGNYSSTTNKIDPPPTISSVNGVSRYPQAVKDGFKAKIQASGGSSLNTQDVLAQELEIYLKNRTRRVPYSEIAAPDGTGALGSYDSDGDGIDTSVFASGTIDPPDAWSEITNTSPLSLTTAKLEQTQPEQQKKDGKETYVGDRILVGNNLPAFWKKDGKYVTGRNEKQFLGTTINWTSPTNEPRYRTTQVVPLPDIGISDRNGFWEDAAAQEPLGSANTGGLRVITGAGIYRNDSSSYTALSTSSFLPKPITLDSGGTIPNAPRLAGESTATPYNLVWSDLMAMTGGANSPTAPPDLRMRATAVYHYKGNAGTSQTPIACVSSYYDPTNATSARNPTGLPDVSGVINGAQPANGRSNNGVVYPPPYTTTRFAAIATYLPELKAQAKLMFPNGRIVNEPLQQALQKLNTSGQLADTTKPLSLSENSAIDAAICALRILTDNIFTPNSTVLPHGAIKEATFLDARQVRAIDKTPANYDLELEQRQPLEIRVTDLNIGQLAARSIGSSTKQEYILPNSGIIYASRDDALADLSDTSVERELLSPTDFRLDATRRPNGIRLINSSNLARENNYREEEKGLILVTNLPAYVRGNFNLHQQPGSGTATEEFEETLDSNWGNFYNRHKPFNNNFACRPGQTGCGSNGDQWRPATIISDAITLLSNSFRDGFRSEGDYDLNNNAGSSATRSRLRNGFWNNNFVTSAFWWLASNTSSSVYPYDKTTGSHVGSYLTNGVTPIQRRVDFPEYLMEYCPKIPVSQCQPADWVINSSGTKATSAIGQTFSIATHQAGTTAQAASSTLQRYARRVAFKRRSNGTLELKEWNNKATPIPLGINSSGNIDEFPYDTYSAKSPRIVKNALWFRTTNNTSGEPYNNPSYRTDKPLAYIGTTRIISPPTPEIPGIPSLNLPEGNAPSNYTICTNENKQGSTEKFLIERPGDIDLDRCPSATLAQIAAVRNALVNTTTFNPNSSVTDNIVEPIRTGTFGAFPAAAGTTTIFTSNPLVLSQAAINVIDIGGDFNTSTACTTIKLVGNENSIFVLRKPSNSQLSFGGGSSHCGIQVQLEGVEPNNVIWAINANVHWNAVDPTKPHKMVGTFITDSTGSPKWETVNFEDGGRILGPNGVPSAPNFVNSKVYAIASNGQPYLVPILQIHSPEGTPSTSSDSLPTNGNLESEWLSRVAANATMNAVFVSGNSPSRPAEESAGLHNFVRFIETWQNTAQRTLNIRGSFIQFKRTAYATAPFATVLVSKSGANDGSLSIFGYIPTVYKVQNGTPVNGTLPYYKAPTWQWGFDVAILSQSPDLFAQKFTQQPTNPPDEFFRQVDRNDSWIETLLCAAKGSGTSYSYAVDPSDRPTSCPSLSSYND
ncbi:hormogonium polysaccharide biosynthesis protein HpsA [Gloeocapsopsis crepidinum]|uniref:hormogonium polysaccharide biosynthesis protein HpsA n=1 Tax=Gloeocapsopsis crepidinum TaxID=693223 RepID=UPI003F702E24